MASILLTCCFSRVIAAQDIGGVLDRSRFSNLTDGQFSLLEEFFNAYKRLKAGYQDTVISAKGTEFRLPKTEDGLPINAPSTDLVPIYRMEWEYRSREAKYFRLDGKRTDPAGKIQEVLTGIIRPDESFLLGQDEGSGKHYLKAHGKNRDEYLSILYSYVFSVAPFAFGPRLLEYEVFFPQENKLVTSIEVSESAEDATDVIATVVTTFNNDRGTVITRIQLWRNRDWAVKRIDSESHTNTDQGEVISRNLQECAYDGETNGFPLLKRVLQETRSGYAKDDELLLRRRNIIEVSNVTAGPSDLGVFDVGNLIPKFERVGQTKSPLRNTWILIVNGVVLVIIGVVISRKGKKGAEQSRG